MTKRNRTNLVPVRPLVFKLPQVPRRASLRAKGRIAPEPKPAVPPDQDVDFMAQYAEWHVQYPGGSLIEYVVWDYLTTEKKWLNHEDFEYQWPVLGGRTQFGGFVVDFYIYVGRFAWNIQGLRYHLQNPEDRAQVQLQAAMLTARGIKTISLWEDDLLYRTDYTLRAALVGQEVQTHKDEVGIYV